MQNNKPFQFVSFITEGTPAHYTWYVPHGTGNKHQVGTVNIL